MEKSREGEEIATSLFVVGDRFSSYKELEQRIEVYEETNFIQLGHKDSRTLEGAKKRTPKRVENANKDLQYYSLCLSCNYGGKKYHQRSSGQRKQRRLVFWSKFCITTI